MSNKKALIVMNMQVDFCEGGSVATNNSLLVIPVINRIKNKFDLVVFGNDSHLSNHKSFKEYGGDFLPHCIKGTSGEQLHPLIEFDNANDLIIKIGTNWMYDSHSIFYDGKANSKKTNLHLILKGYNINTIYVCGLGVEYGVQSTVLDAYKARYDCYIVEDAVTSYFPEKVLNLHKSFSRLGVKIVNSGDIT